MRLLGLQNSIAPLLLLRIPVHQHKVGAPMVEYNDQMIMCNNIVSTSTVH